MSYRIVVYILGWVLTVESVLLLIPALIALIYRENAGLWFLLTAALCALCGQLMARVRLKSTKVYAREGFAVVGLAWVVMSLFGAIPFVLSGDIPNYLDALFETVSGFTTTGASIMPAVEQMNRSTVFWRSFTHWVGGMGIFVFMLAIVPLLGGSTLNLMKAESPGPVVGKLVPKIGKTSRILYTIYFALTLAEFIVLALCGMPVFESLCHAVATAGTGGFSTYNAGYIALSPLLQNVTTVFMLLFGVNFQFYFFLTLKRVKTALRMSEVRTYAALVVIASLLIAFNIFPLYRSVEASLRHGFFQVATAMTTTGYASADFDKWPAFSQTILVMMMFVGACAGSTGGGIKVSRFMILFKTIRKELDNLIHPRYIKKIQMDGEPIAHETIRNTNVYMAVYLGLFAFSVLFVSIDNHDFTTNFTAVLSAMNNIGPGLIKVGPTGNFAFFSWHSKLILIFDMLAGRLELFPIILLCIPQNWKRYT